MFTLKTNKSLAKSFRRDLYELLVQGATLQPQRLSTPAGSFEAQLIVRSDLDLWAYLSAETHSGHYNFWLGRGVPSWQAAIEINIPEIRNLSGAGQLVMDARGVVQLAHRGGLGGGKYAVSRDVFTDLIQGFEQDVVVDQGTARHYFILGNPADRGFERRLKLYVDEAVRIRQIRRSQTAFKTALALVGRSSGKAILGSALSDEPDDESSYTVKQRQVVMRKLHAKVQRALAEELKKRKLTPANERLSGGIGPDIYVLNGTKMALLFEIKVGRGSQSTFTAIGQLIVYGFAGDKKTKRILVTQGLPSSALFGEALRANEIQVLEYALEKKVRFLNLDAILA